MGGSSVGVGPGMMSPQQAMFMQQQGLGGPRAPFPQQGGLLQGPLAYLEKTTSNIGKLLNYLVNINLIEYSFCGAIFLVSIF